MKYTILQRGVDELRDRIAQEVAHEFDANGVCPALAMRFIPRAGHSAGSTRNKAQCRRQSSVV